MSGQLNGKVAIVTGFSNGIGAGIAKAFATAGASVVVNYNANQAGADAIVGMIVKGGGKAVAVQADVSKKARAEALVDAAIKNFGKLDILVNNAGVAEFIPIESVTEEIYRRIYDTNVLGPILASQAIMPAQRGCICRARRQSPMKNGSTRSTSISWLSSA